MFYIYIFFLLNTCLVLYILGMLTFCVIQHGKFHYSGDKKCHNLQMVSKHAISDISTSNLVFCPGWYTTLPCPAHSAVQAHGDLSSNLWEESQPPGDKGGIKVQVESSQGVE